jgi:phenylalanyl-tRNA synthetase alpha chain
MAAAAPLPRAATADEAQEVVLQALEKGEVKDSLAELAGGDVAYHTSVLTPAIVSLVGRDAVASAVKQTQGLALTPEGKAFANHGSVEIHLVRVLRVQLAALPADARARGCERGALLAALKQAVTPLYGEVSEQTLKAGLDKAMAKGWLKPVVDKSGEEKKPADEKKPEEKGKKEAREVRVGLHAPEGELADEVQTELRQHCERGDLPAAAAAALKKRGLLAASTTKTFSLSKGPAFAQARVAALADLDAAALASGAWRAAPYKRPNLQAAGKAPEGGHLHPLLKVRTAYRQVLLELGFSEMPTAKWVESSFWNFDALFQPQAHPARDAHDTFFLHAPSTTSQLPADYLAEVKQTHERGGHGSLGWRYDWKEAEARKNILRTHTTATSARLLHALATQYRATGRLDPVKWFSIDRVFRNEKMDATHLCEFHQIEGVVCAPGLTLAHLMGIIQLFFDKLGIVGLKFKPAFNPYTEPSMEMFALHPKLGEKEVGNSGMFRPEMLRAMGLPPDTQVLAWGLSLERPTMILYGIDHIRELFGPRVSLRKIETNPLCRLSAPAAATPAHAATSNAHV